MDKTERDILEKINNHSDGLLSPSDLFNVIGGCKRDKEIQKLIAENYIEEVHNTIRFGKSYTFYRMTEKGHFLFYSFCKRIWLLVRGDIKNVVFSIVASVITAVIVSIITNKIIQK